MAAVDSFNLLFDQIARLGSEYSNSFIDVCATVGAWYVFRFTLEFTIYSFAHARCFVKRKPNFVKAYGRWAVVTGSTSGIGQQFCRELANCGMNIILFGRNQQLLDEESKYLQKRYGVHTITIVLDFCSASAETYATLADNLREKEIGILINNAGLHYDYPMQFNEVDLAQVLAMTQINISGVTMLTRIIAPLMTERKRGLIVNVSSSAGNLPFPLISLYSSSKAFVSHFSSCLHAELKHHNVHVQSLEPSYITTRMTDYSKLLQVSKFVTPDVRSYVRGAVKSFGSFTSNTGYYPHTIQFLIVRWTPKWLVLKMSNWLHEYLHREGRTNKLKLD